MVRSWLSQTGILSVLCGLFLCGCGDASTASQPGQMQSGGAGGSLDTPSAGASGRAVTGAGSGGTSAGGGAQSAAGSAGMAGATGGASGSGPPLVYVGSSNGQISLYTLDLALGKLGFVKSVAAGNYPSFMAFDPARAHLYAVNEPDAMVASFAVDPHTGDLTLLNRVASGGATPAFVSVDRSGKYVMVANYGAGTTRIFPIAPDGSLGAPTDDKSPGAMTHMILPDPSNQFVFVMNLGSDLISQFLFDAARGTLTPNSVPSVSTKAKAGPRHLAFHPNGKFAYVIDEVDSTMSAYAFDARLGQLTPLQSLSTLPLGTDGTGNTAAEVVVAPSGSFVYGSNRGDDSIVTFSVDTTSGKLTYLGTTPSGGNVPRSFTLSADGTLLLVANQSGNVTSFSVNITTGALTKISSIDAPVAPEFVAIVTLPGSPSR